MTASASPISAVLILLVFALCHLLGYYFMLRIKNLKDQQLYRVEKGANDSVFAPLLTKIADLAIIEEQWDAMMRLRVAPTFVLKYNIRG